MAILYCPVFDCQSVVCEFDGRFVLVELAFRGAVFHVACNYAPTCNPDHDEFFVHCINAIDSAVPTILCGDFNIVLDCIVECSGLCPFDVSCLLMSKLCYVVYDLFRLLCCGYLA